MIIYTLYIEYTRIVQMNIYRQLPTEHKTHTHTRAATAYTQHTPKRQNKETKEKVSAAAANNRSTQLLRLPPEYRTHVQSINMLPRM